MTKTPDTQSRLIDLVDHFEDVVSSISGVDFGDDITVKQIRRYEQAIDAANDRVIGLTTSPRTLAGKITIMEAFADAVLQADAADPVMGIRDIYRTAISRQYKTEEYATLLEGFSAPRFASLLRP